MSKLIKFYTLCHVIVCHSASIKLFLFFKKMRGLAFCLGNGEESTLEKHMQKLIKDWIVMKIFLVRSLSLHFLTNIFV